MPRTKNPVVLRHDSTRFSRRKACIVCGKLIPGQGFRVSASPNENGYNQWNYLRLVGGTNSLPSGRSVNSGRVCKTCSRFLDVGISTLQRAKGQMRSVQAVLKRTFRNGSRNTGEPNGPVATVTAATWPNGSPLARDADVSLEQCLSRTTSSQGLQPFEPASGSSPPKPRLLPPLMPMDRNSRSLIWPFGTDQPPLSVDRMILGNPTVEDGTFQNGTFQNVTQVVQSEMSQLCSSEMHLEGSNLASFSPNLMVTELKTKAPTLMDVLFSATGMPSSQRDRSMEDSVAMLLAVSFLSKLRIKATSPRNPTESVATSALNIERFGQESGTIFTSSALEKDLIALLQSEATVDGQRIGSSGSSLTSPMSDSMLVEPPSTGLFALDSLTATGDSVVEQPCADDQDYDEDWFCTQEV